MPIHRVQESKRRISSRNTQELCVLNIKTWCNQLVVKFVYTTTATAAKANYRESAGGGGGKSNTSDNNPQTKTQERGNMKQITSANEQRE